MQKCLYKLPLMSKFPRSSCTIISEWLNCYNIFCSLKIQLSRPLYASDSFML